MFEVAIETGFSAAHCLRGYRGKCEELHGHNWKVEVAVRAQDLDSTGLAIDFGVLKEKTGKILAELDHRYLNDHPHFSEINPSSENIAAFVYGRLEKELESEQVSLCRVTVWESDSSRATYRKPDA
jgi:6-pyruvoyltetrahydropterin/6-carboxytetrahydropterin synthase